MRSITAAIAIALAVTAGLAGPAPAAAAANEETRGLIQTSLQCIAVFDVAAPAFPARAQEIQKYRARAAAQYKRSSGASDDQTEDSVDELRADFEEAVKDGRAKLDGWLSDCAQIYAD